MMSTPWLNIDCLIHLGSYSKKLVGKLPYGAYWHKAPIISSASQLRFCKLVNLPINSLYFTRTHFDHHQYNPYSEPESRSHALKYGLYPGNQHMSNISKVRSWGKPNLQEIDSAFICGGKECDPTMEKKRSTHFHNGLIYLKRNMCSTFSIHFDNIKVVMGMRALMSEITSSLIANSSVWASNVENQAGSYRVILC